MMQMGKEREGAASVPLLSSCYFFSHHFQSLTQKKTLRKRLFFYKYLLRSYPHKSEYEKQMYVIPFANRNHFTIVTAI